MMSTFGLCSQCRDRQKKNMLWDSFSTVEKNHLRRLQNIFEGLLYGVHCRKNFVDNFMFHLAWNTHMSDFIGRAQSILNMTQTEMSMWGMEIQSVRYFSYCVLGCQPCSPQNFDIFSRNFQKGKNCIISVSLVEWLKLNNWSNCSYIHHSFPFVHI